jgi:uncharacterized protein YhbP (UPF0306 family)
MSRYDEPVLGDEFDFGFQETIKDPTLLERIRGLVTEEPFAVLCTQGHGQPYGSLVAFAFSADLTAAVFATSIATRKFRLLSECNRVALLVDNRGKFPDDMMKVGAITVTGCAIQVEAGPKFERWAALLTARHPYLKTFVTAPSTALFRIEVARYLHVTRFQEVRQWIPGSTGP